MPLEHLAIEAITEADLGQLVNDGVTERKTLEYKRELPGNTDHDRKEFVRDVSSFANALGGHLLYGVREENGRPTELCGVEVPNGNVGAVVTRLDNMIRDGIRPRLTGLEFGSVTLQSGRFALILRIARSWASPHMVTSQSEGRFYSRNANGKYPLDVDELRQAFTMTASIRQRARTFRADRIAAIENGELPVKIGRTPIFILHILPADCMVEDRYIDIGGLDRDVTVSEIFPARSSRITFDWHGVSFYPSSLTVPCLTFFRSGGAELASPLPLNAQSDNAIFETDFERDAVELCGKVIAVQQRLGLAPPLIMMSAINVRGRDLNISHLNNRWGNGHPIQKDPLLIPEVSVESFTANLEAVIRPVFDGFWLAAGWPRSMSYNPRGERVGWLALDR